MKHTRSSRWLAVPLALAALLAAGPALAYHETLGIGGGAPVHVLILLAVAVVVALVLLSRWKPAARGRKRSGMRPPKPAKKARRR